MSNVRSWRFTNAPPRYDKDDEDKFRARVGQALQDVSSSFTVTGGSGALEIDSNGAIVAAGVNALNLSNEFVATVTQTVPTVVVGVTLATVQPNAHTWSVDQTFSSHVIVGVSVTTPALYSASGSALNLGDQGNNRWQITTSGHLIALADATYDIGTSSANRPRNGFFTNSVFIGTATNPVGSASLTVTSSASAGSNQHWVAGGRIDLTWYDSAGAADEKRWDLSIDGHGGVKTFEFLTRSDAGVAGQRIFVATRSGNTLSSMSLVPESNALVIGGAAAAATVNIIGVSSSVALTLDGGSGTTRDFIFRTGSSNRWVVRANATAESGANAGTDFQLLARDDTGAIIDSVLTITRAAAGTISIGPAGNRPVVVGSDPGGSDLFRNGGSSRLQLGVGIRTNAVSNMDVYASGTIPSSVGVVYGYVFEGQGDASTTTQTGMLIHNNFITGATITNAYGIQIWDGVKNGTAAVTTQFGLKVLDQTAGATNYAIFTGTGDVSLGDRLVFRPAASKIVPGATSFSLRNTADSADNFILLNAGDATLRTKLTLPGPVVFTTAASKIVPGATSFSLRNTADSADNFILLDAGDATLRTKLTLPGPITLTAAASKIIPGATSLSLRNNADGADNVLVADVGTVTLRNALTVTSAVTVGAGNTSKILVDGTDGTLASGEMGIAENVGELWLGARSIVRLLFDDDNNGTGSVRFMQGTQASPVTYMIVDTTAAYPQSSGLITLGKSANRWGKYWGQDADFSLDVKMDVLGTFNHLGTRFDGSTPAGPQAYDVMSWQGADQKWEPRFLQTNVSSGVLTAGANGDGTYSVFAFDGRTPAGTSIAGPTPTVTAIYGGFIVDMGTTPPSGFVWDIEWTNSANANTGGPVRVTSQKMVFQFFSANSTVPFGTTATTFQFKVSQTGATAAVYGTLSAALAPSLNTEVNAYGLIVAAQIACVNLAAISADMGIIAAGVIADNIAPASQTAGIFIKSTAFETSIPSGWLYAINFSSVAPPSTVKVLLDMHTGLFTVKDNQGSPITRVNVGKVGGATTDYGVQIYDKDAATIMDFTGAKRILAVPVQPRTDSGASITLDLSTGLTQQVQLTNSAATVRMQNPVNGSRYRIWFQQDVTGSRAFPSVVDDATGVELVMYPNDTKPTLSTTPGQLDLFEFEYRTSPTARYTCMTLETNVTPLWAQVLNFGSDSNTASATTRTFTFGFTALAGELILVAMTIANGNGITTPTGYTLVGGASTGSSNNQLAVFAKIAAGGETSVALSWTTASPVTAFAYRITRWNGNLTNVASAFTNGAASVNPDPPSLTPGWTDRDIWIVFWSNSGNTTTSAYPTNYADNQHTLGNAGTGGPTLATASRGLYATTENPGTGTISASQQWCVATIAVRPPA